MSKIKFFIYCFQLFITISLVFTGSVSGSNIYSVETTFIDNKNLKHSYVTDTLKQKRELRFSLQVVGPNHILTNPKDGPRLSLVGMLGVGWGIEYHYNERNALAFTYLAFAIPGNGLTLDWKANYEINSGTDMALVHFHKIRQFELGYGPTFSHKVWAKKTTLETSEPMIQEGDNWSVGITTTAKYRLWKSFFATFHYSPSFIETYPNTGNLRYEHSLSIGIIGTIRIFRRKFN